MSVCNYLLIGSVGNVFTSFNKNIFFLQYLQNIGQLESHHKCSK